ncbi:hypothetical protein BDQ12DRAFT_738431 [Crucibulum laeve]|uniref:F-box domain-containing protein n=1 Tax=Crucibulum laeve TaxID=68775 RepID=A0A5C3LZ31_9AGAR|nr:hypothetical protein BDQ12DRAFT_738431 [Crucibulum laeve]
MDIRMSPPIADRSVQINTNMDSEGEVVDRTICANYGTYSTAANVYAPQTVETLALLRSGYIPSDSERFVIEESIKDGYDELGVWDREIYRLRAILYHAEQQYRCAEDFIHARKALLSHTRTIPIDILGEIFTHCLHGPETWAGYPAAVALSHVCSKWRTAALAMSALWSTFSIEFDLLPSGDAVLEYMNACINRSRRQPLSFKILASNDPYDSITNLRIIDLLESCSERWEHVTFSMPRDSLLNTPLSWPGSFPKLKSLKLEDSTSMPPHASNKYSPIRFTANAPRLRKLALCNLPTNFIEGNIWSQLTELRLQGNGMRSTKDILQLLSKAGALVRLHVEDAGSINPYMFSGARVRHIYLRYLTIWSPKAQRFLEHLVLPNLKGLDIDYCETPINPYPAVSSGTLTRLLERSQCQLKDLALTDTPVSELLKILSMTPSLTNLSLRNFDITTPFLMRLAFGYSGFGEPAYLPKLRELSLDAFPSRKVWPDIAEALSAVVKSRTTGVTISAGPQHLSHLQMLRFHLHRHTHGHRECATLYELAHEVGLYLLCGTCQ